MTVLNCGCRYEANLQQKADKLGQMWPQLPLQRHQETLYCGHNCNCGPQHLKLHLKNRLSVK